MGEGTLRFGAMRKRRGGIVALLLVLAASPAGAQEVAVAVAPPGRADDEATTRSGEHGSLGRFRGKQGRPLGTDRDTIMVLPIRGAEQR